MKKNFVVYIILLACLAQAQATGTEVIDIGSRLELFVDYYLIDKLDNAQLKLHEPRMVQSPVNVPGSAYATVIKDGQLYRYYYRDYIKDYKGKFADGNPGEITCYAESRDGINWTKPNLGLFEINGSRENNVIVYERLLNHNFSPFLDKRPGVSPRQRFKALAGVQRSGLVAFISADGIGWEKLRKAPVFLDSIAGGHCFDSQNVSFWSEAENCYVLYYRRYQNHVRRICRSTSKDFINWTKPVDMNANVGDEQLYTSQTHPYFRAPHIYIALPTRFMPKRGASTDIMFMSSRGGNKYDRPFLEAFIRPGLDPARWGNRSNYAALNVVPTGSAEMSIYVRRHRYILRTDGFVSVNAGCNSGEMVTKPLKFAGKELVINYSTSAAGSIRVEIQNADGEPLPGFALADSTEIFGDEIERVAAWKGGNDVSSLAEVPVRLRFVMKDADLFSIRFRQ